jgi:transcriptional regulator with XRE-family HTH domain
MRRTKDAAKILDQVTGDDVSLRRVIAEDRLNLRIGQMIHDKRTAAGLTQGQLAKLVGTTQSVIARLEDADYEGHSVRMLSRIAQALDAKLEVSIVPAPRSLRRRNPAHEHSSKPRKTGTR